MKLRALYAMSLLTISGTALADAIDINLRDSAAQIQYRASMGHDTLGRSEMHMGFLYTNDKGKLGDLGILVQDEVGKDVPGLTAGVGLKGVVANIQSKNSSALALGGLLRYAPLENRRFGITGVVYLSPNIVTFGDAERYTETGLSLDFEIIPQAVAYVGYRHVKLAMANSSDLTVDEGVHVGVKLSF
ncbi:MAG: YfaZ family outer membrane protein [Gallionella sp.]